MPPGAKFPPSKWVSVEDLAVLILQQLAVLDRPNHGVPVDVLKKTVTEVIRPKRIHPRRWQDATALLERSRKLSRYKARHQPQWMYQRVIQARPLRGQVVGPPPVDPPVGPQDDGKN